MGGGGLRVMPTSIDERCGIGRRKIRLVDRVSDPYSFDTDPDPAF